MTTDSLALLRRYVADRSEAAFTELVGQHIALVYSAALRQLGGNATLAQDVTQSVFTDLARKAPRLTRHISLTGWLYTSTRYSAAKARRAEARRLAREQQAHAMNQLLQPTTPDPTWEELRPVLDEAMHALNAADREAVLLRFFERVPLAEVGARLGLTENAARMRVERSLEKLRAALAKRGVTSTAAALAAALAGKAVGAVPAGLAASVSSAALAAAVAGGGSLTLMLGLLATTKAKLLISGAAVVIVAGGLLLLKRLPAPGVDATATATLASETPQAAKDSNPPTAANSDGVVAPATADAAASSNRLVLRVVAADSGQPVPSVTLDYWLWEGTKVGHEEPLRSTRFGVCEVPVPRDTTTELILVSQSDGFADTRLAWRPDRGEQIPEEYTLRVARSVPISGLVVDAEGQPVSGALVSFGSEANPASETRPQSDNFGWPFHITATTDAEGRWRIDRIAKATLRNTTCAASHSNHVRSVSMSLSRAPEAERQLLTGSYVFKLGHAVTVRGLVLDPEGQPVADANVLVGHVSETGSREVKSLADGSFAVSGCKPGKNLLSAKAEGFAPTTMDVNLADDSESFKLTLQRGKLLRLLVVNQTGLPISKAQVWLNPFESGPNGKISSPVQVEFNRKTDADGRLEWDSAPDAELRFDVSASGYMRVSDIIVRPDGQEHTITLPPSLTIVGTVRDAASGQPIPRFRIITGWPESHPFDNSTNLHWSTIDRFWLSFDGGKFRHVYEEPVVVGTRNPSFMFKFEADGYAPFVARPVQADEGEVEFNVALKAGAITTVNVILPDGRPASGADIGLVYAGANLQLLPGGFSRRPSGSGGHLFEADARGSFTLPPDDTLTLVLAAHPSGFGEATPDALAADPKIRLQPWGRLEGVFLTAGKPATNRSVFFQFGKGDLRAVSTDFTAYQVKTDAEGKFAFPQVPPGKHKLVELVPIEGTAGSTVWQHQPLTDVEIRPGETATITLGGDK